MAFSPTEVGNLSRFVYAKEGAFGVAGTPPIAGQIVRQVGYEMNPERVYIDNPELRPDGMVAAGAGGALRGKGVLPGRLSYGTYDDFFAAALGNFSWASDIIKVKALLTDSAATIAIAATGKTFTRADGGSFITDGFAVGDLINVSGFTNAANNGPQVISAVSALVITCSTATGLVDEAANAAGNISLNTRPSFITERQHLVNGLYIAFPGTVVDGFEMGGKVDAAVDIKFNLFSKAVNDESYSSVFASAAAVNTNDLITSWDGSVKDGGTALAGVTSWSMKSTRNMDLGIAVGSSVLYDIQPRAQHITGEIELYFYDWAMYTKMRSQADVALQLNLGPGGTKSYTFDLTKARIKNWKSVPKDGLMTATVEYESFAPNSGTNTSLKITRIP